MLPPGNKIQMKPRQQSEIDPSGEIVSGEANKRGTNGVAPSPGWNAQQRF